LSRERTGCQRIRERISRLTLGRVETWYRCSPYEGLRGERLEVLG
jgi:hypothetical protein